MSDFKFSCPACGQNILCDTSGSGLQIPCPNCQKTLTIPSVTPAAAGPVAASAAPQPGSPVRPRPALRPLPPLPEYTTLVGAKTSSGISKPAQTASGHSILAIASLLCSVWAVLGFVPGIICGHMAKARIRSNPSLKGNEMATAGLIISYVLLSLTLVSATTFGLVRLHYRPIRVVRESSESLAALKARIVDEVLVSEPNSENEHSVEGQNMQSGTVSGKRRRSALRGGSFSYVMKVLPGQPMSLNCRYWGSEQKGHTFDIAVDDQIIATQNLDSKVPGHYFDMEYKIPASLTRGKNQVKVEFQAQAKLTAGGLFGCQILKR